MLQGIPSKQQNNLAERPVNLRLGRLPEFGEIDLLEEGQVEVDRSGAAGDVPGRVAEELKVFSWDGPIGSHNQFS